MKRGGSNVLGGRLHDLLLSPKRICPDCRQSVPWRSVRITLAHRVGREVVVFAECPLCGVGSPKREWRARVGKSGRALPNDKAQPRPESGR